MRRCVVAPIRRMAFSSITFRNFDWSEGEMCPISSSRMVPPCAVSNRPARAGLARARDVSLAAARFPEQEDGGCRRTGRAGHAHHPLDHAAQPVDRRGLAEDLARRRLPFAVIGDFAALPRAAERAVDAQPQLFQIERLLYVVAGPEL